MTTFQTESPMCSASGPDNCPKWHYCNVASNRCKPCTLCGVGRARKATSHKCMSPLLCSEGRPLKCRELYSKETNAGRVVSYKEGYLGSTVITTCSVKSQPHEAKLECQRNSTSDSIEWQGDFTCVTEQPPPVINGTFPISTVPGKAPLDHNIGSDMIIPVVVGIASFLVLSAVIIVACVMLQKYRKKHEPDTSHHNSIQEVSPQTDIIHEVTTNLPCQNDNSNWNDSQNVLNRLTQESRRESQREVAPFLSLDLPIDERRYHSQVGLFNPSEETEPKTVKTSTEMEHHLTGWDEELADGDTDYSQLGSYPYGSSSSPRNQRSLQGQYEERQSLVVSSYGDDDVCYFSRHSGVSYASNRSAFTADCDQTQAKEAWINRPTEHIWTDSMQCASHSSLAQISLSVGSSSSSDIVLHNLDAVQTHTVPKGLANTATKVRTSDHTQGSAVELQPVSDQSSCRQARSGLASDSLLTRTSPSFAPSEETHFQMQNGSHNHESQDSGISQRSQVSNGQKEN